MLVFLHLFYLRYSINLSENDVERTHNVSSLTFESNSAKPSNLPVASSNRCVSSVKSELTDLSKCVQISYPLINSC